MSRQLLTADKTAGTCKAAGHRQGKCRSLETRGAWAVTRGTLAESAVRDLPGGKVLRRDQKQGTLSGGSCDNPARLNKAPAGLGRGDRLKEAEDTVLVGLEHGLEMALWQVEMSSLSPRWQSRSQVVRTDLSLMLSVRRV